MSGDLVKVSQLYEKDIFAKKNVNVRSGAGENRTILTTIKAGKRIGKVYSHASGFDAKGNKDGSTWLILYEKYNNPSGFGAVVKLMPGIIDWDTLKEQGAQTVEEEKKAEEEKNKTTSDKIMDSLKDAGKWILIAWVASKALSK